MQWPVVTSWADSLHFSTCLEMAVHINILIRWRVLRNPQIVKWKGCRFILIFLQWRGVQHWRGQLRNVSLILTSPKVSSCHWQLRFETPGGDLFCEKQSSVLCHTFHFLQTANAPSAKGRQGRQSIWYETIDVYSTIRRYVIILSTPTDNVFLFWATVMICLTFPCPDCRFNCHKRCASKVPRDCLGEVDFNGGKFHMTWVTLLI